MAKKEITINDLAIMMQHGFEGVDKKFDSLESSVNKRFDKLERLIF